MRVDTDSDSREKIAQRRAHSFKGVTVLRN
jgi:hypothetical protein